LQPILIHQTNTKMKKILTLIAVAGIFTFVACGPSAEQKAAAEKAKADSMKVADSINSAKMAMAAKAKADSMAKAAASKGDSMKKDSMPKK
jgi:ABC-type Zn uptake system ZnuABC Zn-binding protein ZnuA